MQAEGFISNRAQPISESFLVTCSELEILLYCLFLVRNKMTWRFFCTSACLKKTADRVVILAYKHVLSIPSIIIFRGELLGLIVFQHWHFFPCRSSFLSLACDASAFSCLI